MPTLMDPIIQEFEQELAATRRLIEAIPADQLGFKPHEKSMSIGRLAQHIATAPAFMTGLMRAGEFNIADRVDDQPDLESVDAILAELDASFEAAKAVAVELDDAKFTAPWRLRQGDQVIMEIPTIGVARSFMLNHLYHHRGQLSVYLRLMDVPVPSTYGPTADDNPFAS